MSYKFTENANYEDFSGGRVIYHNSGFTNYPVRLACEIFMRCLARVNRPKVSIYDPCCGSGYILTILGFLYGDRISFLWGSDISPEAVLLAKKNLQLLSKEGLLRRKAELEDLHHTYRKDSHAYAIESVKRLLILVKDDGIPFNIFNRDILTAKGDYPQADIIITDVPYGGLADWSSLKPFAMDTMLENTWHNLKPKGVVAVSSDKAQKVNNPAYMRVEKFQVGKRKVEIITKKPLESSL